LAYAWLGKGGIIMAEKIIFDGGIEKESNKRDKI